MMFPLWAQLVAVAAWICIALSGLLFMAYLMPYFERISPDAEPVNEDGEDL